jgi:hypothetical protein
VTAYYPFWVLLIVLSLWASLGGFIWAHRHRQFKEQDRARYLALRGETRPVLFRPGRGVGLEGMAMLAVLGIGIAGLLTTLVVVVLRNMGGRL